MNRYTYVLLHSTDVAIEWAIFRVHPDDPELVCAVPLDDGSMVGTPDIDLSDLAGRPMVARCNHGVWLPIQLFTPREGCAGPLPREAFLQIAQRLAAMARGQVLPSRESVDFDPDYEDLMLTIGKAVQEIEQQVPGPLFFFEDYNCPGMVYLGTIAHLRGMEREGGDPHAVNPRRIDRGGVIDCGQEGFVTARPCPDHWAI